MGHGQWTVKAACAGLVAYDVCFQEHCGVTELEREGYHRVNLRPRTQTRCRHLQVSLPYKGSHILYTACIKYGYDSDGLGERTR